MRQEYRVKAPGRKAKTVRLLVDRGAAPDGSQAGGITPMYSASVANRRDLVVIWHDSLVESRGATA
jgi:hypothetical protein